ncbi:uncharacterized protein LOC102670723 [Apis dorsata]|uniref:uncharacterized protein LOC102670723 n=1 Tax=Apis dorsata TaxID=7462 RepID=UPI001293F0AB|nr:uncharacterized protein LOC102670723 [Apis dorsata]
MRAIQLLSKVIKTCHCNSPVYRIVPNEVLMNHYEYFGHSNSTKILLRMMKTLHNNVNDTVKESLYGVTYAFPQLEYQVAHKVVLMPKLRDRRKVSLICGGGSGHEPFASGYVGNGMLAAAVAGSIYSSPPSEHVSYAINRVSEYNKTGVLVIAPNYTGDLLNFGIAIEKARQKGIKVENINVNEDCSIPEKDQSRAGKRGLTGIVFVIKIAGALAEEGLPLETVYKTAQDVLDNLATTSVGLSACAIPGQRRMFELAEDEIEVGMGIHGEAGYEKTKLKPSYDIASLMLDRISNALSLKSGDSVAVIINNFGALSQLEQGIVAHDVVKVLRNMNINPLRLYWGMVMTSLNSAGVHVTLLKLPDKHKSLFLKCLDAPTDAPRWLGSKFSVPIEPSEPIIQHEVVRKVEQIGIEISSDLQNLLKNCLKNACENAIREEEHLNDLDRGCGDSDAGSTLKRLAIRTLTNLDKLQFSYPASAFLELAHIAEEEMGGASGALYCLFFTTISTQLISPINKKWTEIWARAFRTALNSLTQYGKAMPGDRSMIDPLNALCDTLDKMVDKPLRDICDALRTSTWQACEATKHMKPMVGRASYVKQAKYLKNVDAGAFAVVTCVNAITDILKNFPSSK